MRPLLARSLRPVLLILAIAAALGGLSSCADTEELRLKLKKKNEKYLDWQERRQMRQDARQERTDAWFDRVMH